ncbi:hypothetical protein BC830DRAFT_826696 [Chytriomyces sp. MP71]|nr:hypothetical protein BC830DRAFT_826696 [Chytriomyces sp. MP71]
MIQPTSHHNKQEHSSNSKTPQQHSNDAASAGKSANTPYRDTAANSGSPSSARKSIPTHAAKSGMSGFWFGVLVVICVFATAGIAMAAFVAYQKMNSPKSYKRF